MTTDQPKRPEVAWEPEALFREYPDKDGLAVRVQKLPLRFPRYSLEIGRVRDDKFQRYLSPAVQVANGEVNLTPLHLEALNGLIVQAEHHIYAAMQATEDRAAAARLDRDSRFSDGRSPTRRTGKTARDKAKRAGRRPEAHG